MATNPKRGYSREFPTRPAGKAPAGRYLLDAIPPALWKAARAKAKREGLSIRHVLLSGLQAWTEGGAP